MNNCGWSSRRKTHCGWCFPWGRPFPLRAPPWPHSARSPGGSGLGRVTSPQTALPPHLLPEPGGGCPRAPVSQAWHIPAGGGVPLARPTPLRRPLPSDALSLLAAARGHCTVRAESREQATNWYLQKSRQTACHACAPETSHRVPRGGYSVHMAAESAGTSLLFNCQMKSNNSHRCGWVKIIPIVLSECICWCASGFSNSFPCP